MKLTNTADGREIKIVLTYNEAEVISNILSDYIKHTCVEYGIKPELIAKNLQEKLEEYINA